MNATSTTPTRQSEATPFALPARSLEGVGKRPFGIYIHVPFCRHRCGYCDFTLVADRDDLADNYLGSKKAVKFGAVLMALGYFTLCFGGEAAKPWTDDYSNVLGAIWRFRRM